MAVASSINRADGNRHEHVSFHFSLSRLFTSPLRLSLILNSIANLRLASQTQANPPDIHKMVQIAIRFEGEIFEKSADRVGSTFLKAATSFFNVS